ncbi:MAG: peptidylprolyl isomerase [Gammaproteobacteria bacterium]|nr:peptidylprolyl isomerase [Gammaproteobacteria bacterium]
MKVRLETTLGNITLELFEDEAPKTVANFVQYVEEGFYDGTIFHRVIDGFMIQGGGFEPGMHQKPTRGNIENEADNGLSNDSGTVAMARTPDPHSASAQFFINANDNDFLNFSAKTRDGWGYCVFGKVVDGMDVVTQIEESDTTTRAGHQNVPKEDIVINRAVTVD